jgi:hypothetical protein
MPVESLLSQWHWQRGVPSQLPKTEVIRVDSSCCLIEAFLCLYTTVSSLAPKVHIHAVDDGWPWWQPFNVAVASSYWQDVMSVRKSPARWQQKTVASVTIIALILLLWGLLAVAAAWQPWSLWATCFKMYDCDPLTAFYLSYY